MCRMGKKLGPVIELTLGLCLRNLNLFPDFASLLSSHNYTDLLGGGGVHAGGVCCSPTTKGWLQGMGQWVPLTRFGVSRKQDPSKLLLCGCHDSGSGGAHRRAPLLRRPQRQVVSKACPLALV